MILAVDPGPEYSAYCWYDPIQGRPTSFAKVENGELRGYLSQLHSPRPIEDCFVIEMIACYGMPVGHTVLETCVFIGRLIELYGAYMQTYRLTRNEVKIHLCKNPKANDGTIRQALIDRFGFPGTKKCPGILYGCVNDMWAALALAVTFADTHK